MSELQRESFYMKWGANYYCQYGGGLGDIIDQIYGNPKKFNSPMELKENEKMIVGYICHNPACVEFYQNHPKIAQLDIRNPGYCLPHEARKRNKMPLPHYEEWPEGKGEVPIMYPHEKDKPILENLPEKYIVMACGAGLNGRTIPEEIVDKTAKQLADAGYVLYGVGATYKRQDRVSDVNYQEPVINLVDQLSVPGTIELVRKCRGLVTAHSSMHSAGNAVQCWQMLIYPDQVRRDYDCWAKGRKKGDIYVADGTFEEYNDTWVKKFIEKCDSGLRQKQKYRY